MHNVTGIYCIQVVDNGYAGLTGVSDVKSQIFVQKVLNA